jgi:protein-tyrosine phosphatase
MPSVLFVCTANQFRSPLAAAIFKKRLQAEGISDRWTVSSAGTWVKEKVRAHPTAIQQAIKHNLDLRNHVTREITGEMIEAYDIVIVMTHNQKEALQFEFPMQSGKIVMLSELSDHDEVDIPDPAEINFIESTAIINDLTRAIDQGYYEIIKRTTDIR